MPTVSRPEIADPASYTAAIIAKIGQRDPLDVLAETPAIFTKRLSSASDEELRARPFSGKWSPLEVFGHLRDAEWVYGYRGRAIFCDDQPQIIGMDQDHWVARQQHNRADPAVLLEEFASLRKFNLRFWRSLSESDKARFGVHNERGEETLGRMLPLLAGHDLWHVEQFDRYLAAVRA